MPEKPDDFQIEGELSKGQHERVRQALKRTLQAELERERLTYDDDLFGSSHVNASTSVKV